MITDLTISCIVRKEMRYTIKRMELFIILLQIRWINSVYFRAALQDTDWACTRRYRRTTLYLVGFWQLRPCGLIIVGQPPYVCAWATGPNDISTVVDTTDKRALYTTITIIVLIIH